MTSKQTFAATKKLGGDSVTGVRQGSCSYNDIRCSSGSTNSFVSQMEEAEGSGGDGESRERACDSFNMCIVTTINQGLRKM
jgi:hypothetical protein